MSEIDTFFETVSAAAHDGTLAAITLAKPVGEQARTTVRTISGESGLRFQLAWHEGPQELHKNVNADELIAWLRERVPESFKHVHAFTAASDVSLLVSKRGKLTLQMKRATKAVASANHDRGRSYLIPEGVPCAFLAAAGVMRSNGKVPKAKWSKFRQINRFLELVEDVYDALPTDGPLSVVEFGSGKSHLTFALHHLLANFHNREVSMRAIDRNDSVVQSARSMTRQLGLSGVTHDAAEIAEIALEPPVNLAVWLHACDTATDDAIAKSVEANADVILAVPCCQHEVLHKMDSTSLLDEYGILRERHAAMATDALRAAALEILGYRTQVVEFIDLEHTAKNVLIRAVKRSQPADVTVWRERYASLKSELGLESWRLEELLPAISSS